DLSGIHLFDFGIAAFWRRLRIAKHRLDLGAAERLDAARRIDLVDRHRSAEPGLLAGIRQRAGYRMQDADLHRGRLRARYDRRADETGDSAQSGRLQKPAAADARKIWTRHWLSP